MIADPAIAKKVADLVRRPASPQDGEVIATVRALLRVLEANGLDIHAVAGPLDAPNGKHVSEEQIRRDAWGRSTSDTDAIGIGAKPLGRDGWG